MAKNMPQVNICNSWSTKNISSTENLEIQLAKIQQNKKDKLSNMSNVLPQNWVAYVGR